MAQIDTGIYSNLLRPPKTVQEFDAEAQQAEGNKLQLALQKGQYDAQQRGVADDASYRAAAKGFGDDSSANYQNLLRAGLPAQAASYQKSALEGKKTQQEINESKSKSSNYDSEVKKRDFDVQQARTQQHLSQLVGVNTIEGAHRWLDEAVSAGELPADKVAQVKQQLTSNPNFFNQWKQQAALGGLTVIQQRQDEVERQKIAETERNNRAQVGATYAGQATTRRGQDLVDARARESTAASVSKPFEVTGTDGQPVLVQQDKAGNIKPVQGYSPKTVADKPLNDSQSKALLFGSRAREADKVLAELEKEGTSVSTPGSRFPVVGGVINAFQGAGQQSLDQAKRDFMTAVLRRESGASIAPSEFDTADKQYFPQVGDSQKVIKQKARNRALVIDGILTEVPEKQRGALQPRSNGGASGEWDGGWSIQEVK